jgi:CheY-like chemotaxis protein
MARILLVDDDEFLRSLLANAFTDAGHVVTPAASGREAIKQLEREQPDVVLTDIVMPDEDGIGVIMKIRTSYPALRVVAMSGGVPNSPLYLSVAKKLGAVKILPKPFTPEFALEAIAEAMREPKSGGIQTR